MKEEKTTSGRGKRLLAFLIVVLVLLVAAINLRKTFSSGAFKPSLTDLSQKVLGDKLEFAPQVSTDEPIAQPMVNFQNQVQATLDSLKNLPQDQFEAAKLQLCKEICEDD